MIGKKILPGIITLLYACLPFSIFPADSVSYYVEARLVVYDAETAGDQLVDWFESSGGYFTARYGEFVEGRIPAEMLDGVQEKLKTFGEELQDYTMTASDLSEELRKARASLASREEVLTRNLELLGGADFSGTLAIEREIRGLIGEIERLRARINNLGNSARYAVVRLNLRSQGHFPGNEKVSSFSWINTIDFYSFMEDAPEKRRFSWLPRFGPAREGPDGFSVYRESKLFRAVSPEGVRIRVREVKPEPVMELSFWQSAVIKHLVESGYEQRGDIARLGRRDRDGFLVRWLLPYGQEEYVFSTALIPDGNKLYIIEGAGKLEAYDLHFPAIDKWIRTIAEKL
ncbi:DUF4349 domain-containing protein [Marispirochaeta sp.]|jgi:hypothetical protein|uniref:DUF4349 domain-containing protein n=1 Tax=Marispirochaeta sp. TaxID=2038653 RepID=UPI0029C8DAA2|nr:DUF4349 domain-containing protein [Marispirochaeta sp.]